MTAHPSPCSRDWSATRLGSPLVRPRVVSSSTSKPLMRVPIRPPLSRYSHRCAHHTNLSVGVSRPAAMRYLYHASGRSSSAVSGAEDQARAARIASATSRVTPITGVPMRLTSAVSMMRPMTKTAPAPG